jgi:hypothetical protein
MLTVNSLRSEAPARFFLKIIAALMGVVMLYCCGGALLE